MTSLMRSKFHIPISKFQKYLDLGIWILEFALILRVELHKKFLCASPVASFAIILKALFHRLSLLDLCSLERR